MMLRTRALKKISIPGLEHQEDAGAKGLKCQKTQARMILILRGQSIRKILKSRG